MVCFIVGMAEQKLRKILTERTWNQIEQALVDSKHSAAGAPAKMSDRDFFEAVLYLIRTGLPWRDLPAELGYWHAVYMRFRRWEQRGVWKALWHKLQSERFEQARELLIDSTTIRAHQHAAGAPKKTPQIRLWDALEAD